MNSPGILYAQSRAVLNRSFQLGKHSEEDYYGFYHENCSESLALLFLEEKACELHGVKMTEVVGTSKSPGFLSQIMHPQDVQRCDAGLYAFARGNATTGSLTYLQRLRLLNSGEYKLYFTCARLNAEGTRFQCVTTCLEEDHDFSQEVHQLLEASEYITQHIGTYTRFTPREREIMGYVCRGRSTLEIANHLFRSRHTIEKHKKNIFQKGGFRSNSELIRFALCFNLI